MYPPEARRSVMLGELSVASPVFMGTFHILLDCRPEIIGKLGAFYHDMYFMIETARRWPYRRYSLRQSGVEDTGVAKLLLHPFRDVEDAAFFFIGNILSPNEGVRIIPELRFQRLVDGSDQCLFSPFSSCGMPFVYFRGI